MLQDKVKIIYILLTCYMTKVNTNIYSADMLQDKGKH